MLEQVGAPEAIAGCPVVGIGASAGGIDALSRMLPNIGQQSGMAFVVVLHLDPDHASLLAQVLDRYSQLPVTQIAAETAIEADRIYVIPPNAVLTIQDGRLQLGPPSTPRGQFHPIDEFFTSLALDQGENAACVILSGTGSDGTIGLRSIKEQGGLALAQSGAEYNGMMRSAVATGLVDFVLPAEEMAAKLADYFSHVTRVQGRGGADDLRQEAARQLDQITNLLRLKTGHDFTGYKERTIIRRVERRMHLLQMDDLASFIIRLSVDNREAELLFQDLLIGVTNFFRDADAFATLEREVIPRLFDGRGADDTIRVWIPGCATGEEAYSIAMLLREAAPPSGAGPRLQLFASDIDDRSLEMARIGRYPSSIAKDVSAARLARFFQYEEGIYRVTAELRETCLFSFHNLLQDAPFSRLDLISCRNLLIYLGSDLQERVIPLFHFALRHNGTLFLGTSENVSRHSRLFAAVDKTQRIFRRRGTLDRVIPELPLTTPGGTRRRPPLPGYRQPPIAAGLREAAERQLLDRFAPAYVIVNLEGDVIQFSGRTGKYLEVPAGTPDLNVLSMARPGLHLDLRLALHKASASGQMVVQNRVVIGTNGGRQEIDLYVQPLRVDPPLDTLYMVVFQDLGAVQSSIDTEVFVDDFEGAIVRRLEAELHATRERLQSTSEELESSHEEQKSSNEELQSINEELQSTNEELETSKEELQSINEELQTVNLELGNRVEELSRANNDMSNLLESTQIATVFLDRLLMVKSFTPAARDVFHLVESDAGRSIMHVRPRFELASLQEDAERVLRTLATIEKPVHSREGALRYIMRMLPYRTTDNVINGVVMTFTDITRITAAEARIEQLASDLRARIGELETLLDLLPVGVLVTPDAAEASVLINTYGARLLGDADRHRGLEPVTRRFRLFSGDAEVSPAEQPLQRAAQTGAVVPGWQGRLQDHTGRSVDVMISAAPLFAEEGLVRGAIAAIVDMSEHRRAQAKQQILLNALHHRVKNILATVNALATRMSRSGLSVEQFQKALLSRLAAMGRVHDLLTNGAWSGADVRALAEAALEPYRAGADVELTGGMMRLSATAATTLGMVFHELATNASKYGALSVAGGRIAVSWTLLDPPQMSARALRLTWTERGGPALTGAGQPGFGTSFVTRSVDYELAGTATLAYPPEGLIATLQFPLAGNVEQAERGLL